MQNLYAEYRSEVYTNIRKKWEGWYSDSYNTQHSSVEWLDERAQTIRSFLSEYLSLEKSFVFDIGGDTGEISSRLGAGGFTVLELSNRFESDSPDTDSDGLIPIAIMAHVLEHVADPLAELKGLLQKFEAVYVEVPGGLPVLSLARRSRAMLTLYLFMSSVPALWRKFSRPSTGRRNPASVLRLSEHLTFFSPLTIYALARQSNCEVTLLETEITSPGGDKAKIIQALFRRE
jgi:2-polyprenyl-3-methyl-5-hydroxy-6-metoxy-1,4-benzoquinol methylase